MTSDRIQTSHRMAIPMLAVLLHLSAPAHAQHELERHTDEHGYSYVAVPGDETGVRVYTLENGLTVYLARNDDEPRIRSMIAVRAGAAFDPPRTTGLAHYLEHLLFNGTDRIGALDWVREQPLLEQIEALYQRHRAASSAEDKREIYEQIDQLSVEASRLAVPGEYRALASSIGAVAINGYTEADLSAYWCLIPSGSLERHLMLEYERFRRPALRAFQNELEIVYEEFNGLQDSVRRRREHALNALLFPRHPYGQQTLIGTADHLKNPSITAIRAYYDRYYVPGNMAIVLVGDLEYDRTIQLVDRSFGTMESRPVERPALPTEPPITAPRIATIYGPGPDFVYFGYRMDGAGSRDEKLAMLVDYLLYNRFAGLFDTELNAAHGVSRAGSTVRVRNDYSVHEFEGYPKDGQTLEEVRDLMMAQIDRIKRGDFEDWLMRGAVNNLRRELTANHATIVNLSAACMHSFKRGEPWPDHLAFCDELSTISREEIAAFAREMYGEGYAIVYKRTGEPNVVHAEKPKISPRALNEELESEFALAFEQIAASGSRPEFVDYHEAISRAKMASGIDVDFVENAKTNLFQLHVIFDMGKDCDPRLDLAARYASRLGTSRHTAHEIKARLYELGLTLSGYATRDQTVLTLEGLEESLEAGVALLDHVLSDLVPEERALASAAAEIMEQRDWRLSNPDSILRRGLASYVLYGDRSPVRHELSADALGNSSPGELAELVRGLREYRHRIFFFGSDRNRAVSVLDEHYTASVTKELPDRVSFESRATMPGVYVADFDTTQVHTMVLTRGNRFDPANMGPSNFYGPYLSHVVFREIRNRRSLAYAADGGHLMSRYEDGFDYAYVLARTQTDKLGDALRVMVDLMTTVPGTEEDVRFVRNDQLKRYEAERIRGVDIFWNGESLRRRGIGHDIRRDQYRCVQQMTLEAVRAFFEENIGGRDLAILVVADLDKIDVQALAEFGEVIELEPRYLFNY
ncbi:MAG: M16 family metallopeptidase [Planctomycetota bacterium]|jgi:predicted Zn-dependent peptidase